MGLGLAAGLVGPQCVAATVGAQSMRSDGPSDAVSARVVDVPVSIDATGRQDASGPLIALVGSVPDGTTIDFPAGAIYRMDAGLKFSGRHDLTFEGNGATLRSNGDVHETSSLFALFGNTGIVIRDFYLVGNSPSPGVYLPGQEAAHAVLIHGGSNVDVSGVTISAVYGDAFFVDTWAEAVTIHDSVVRSTGRNGVSIIAGRNIMVERVTFEDSGYCTFDVEANDSTEGASGVRFLDNTAGTWGDAFLAANGAAGSVVDGVTVSGNRVNGSSLLTDITLARRRNIVFTNNMSDASADGPVLRFDHVDGLTVSGNIQPLRSGPLAAIVDSTDVTYGQASAPASSLPAPPSRVMIVTGFAILVILVVLGAYLTTRSRFRRRAP
jgi:hypothetical protein